MLFKQTFDQALQLICCVLAAAIIASTALGTTLDGNATLEELQSGDNSFSGDYRSITRGVAPSLLDAFRPPADIEGQLFREATENPHNTDTLKRLALYYVRTGRLNEAIITLEKVYAITPGNADVALDIAKLIRATKGVVAARAALERFRTQAEEPFPFRVALIQLGYDTGARTHALRLLEEMIAETSSQARATSLRLLLARYLMAEDRPDAARDQVAEVLSTEPKHPDALAFRALFKLNDLDLDGALKDITTGLAAEPESVALLRLAARADWRAGQRAQAVDHLIKAVASSDYQTDIVLDAADVLVNTGRRQEATQLLSEAVKRHPEVPRLVARFGLHHLASEDWDKAEMVATALRQFGTPEAISDSEKIRIAVLRGRGQIEEAQALLSQLGTEGSDLGVVAGVVNTHLARNDRAAAMNYVAELLEQAPDQPALLLIRASLLSMAGETETAESDYRRVVEIIPQSPLAHVSLARHLIRSEKPGEAEAAIRAGLSHRPDDPSLKMPLVEILLRRDEIDAALVLMEELVRAYPDNALVANNYVALVTDYAPDDATRLELAASVAGQLKGSPAPQLRDTYGWLLYKRGDHEAAQEVLAAVLEDIPDNAWANYHMGMILNSQDEHKGAVLHLRRALAAQDATFDKSTAASEIIQDIENK